MISGRGREQRGISMHSVVLNASQKNCQTDAARSDRRTAMLLDWCWQHTCGVGMRGKPGTAQDKKAS